MEDNKNEIQVQNYVETVKDMVISSKKTLTEAGLLKRQISNLKTLITSSTELEYREAKEAYDDARKGIEDKKKAFEKIQNTRLSLTKPLAAAYKEIKSKIDDYNAELKRIEEEKARKAKGEEVKAQCDHGKYPDELCEACGRIPDETAQPGARKPIDIEAETKQETGDEQSPPNQPETVDDTDNQGDGIMETKAAKKYRAVIVDLQVFLDYVPESPNDNLKEIVPLSRIYHIQDEAARSILLALKPAVEYLDGAIERGNLKPGDCFAEGCKIVEVGIED
jgi:hypothetical protein